MNTEKIGPLHIVCRTAEEAQRWGDHLHPADRAWAKLLGADTVIVDEIKNRDGSIVYGCWFGRSTA